MFFEMRFDLGTLDSGERSLPFGLLVFCISAYCFFLHCLNYMYEKYTDQNNRCETCLFIVGKCKSIHFGDLDILAQ